MNNEKLTLSQLEQYLAKAAWILKGPVDAADFKVYIFPLLFFKRISDVYDEEYKEAYEESEGDDSYASNSEFHRFIIPEGAHWDDVRAVTQNVGSAIKGAFSQIEKANPDFLASIFGDAPWTNIDKLPDALLCRLIEHYSQYNLANSNVEPDMLGQAYEYLIKVFADQTNKKAGEFYTPRSVVHLMGLITNAQEGETIYDPACGTAGMLLECMEHVKIKGGDPRTLKLYGQEKNLTTSTIARMNMFLHNVVDFEVERGDTLRNPRFFEQDGRLKQFDLVIANPPFSLKEWGADMWTNEQYGRNIAGVPPKGNGDMAWVQHMIKSMKTVNGRVAVVLPHGALFRKGAEANIRAALMEMDKLDAVIGLGGNIFYGATLSACILVFRDKKMKKKKGKVLFIDATDQIRNGRAQNFLDKKHIDNIFQWYSDWKDVDNHAKVVPIENIKKNDYNLNIPLYVEKIIADNLPPLNVALDNLKTATLKAENAELQLEILLKEFIYNEFE
ncbi:MAG: type I restriction-modification system subunit M [Bacteroidales bacterium]|jgi:type I restriction enzyme M protein|nr:type I restriction-modification system subunit M [Bacteroidales bacterium]